jgi:hypothetical protein
MMRLVNAETRWQPAEYESDNPGWCANWECLFPGIDLDNAGWSERFGGLVCDDCLEEEDGAQSRLSMRSMPGAARADAPCGSTSSAPLGRGESQRYFTGIRRRCSNVVRNLLGAN